MRFVPPLTRTLGQAGLGGLLATSLAIHPAAAATANAQIGVSLTIVPTCAVTAAPLAFGAAPLSVRQIDAQSSITLNCTPDLAFTVAMDDGLNGNRRMSGASTGALLDYELYTDATRTRRWGGRGLDAVTGVAPRDGLVQYAVYARMTTNGAGADRYSDVVTVTVEF